ncbi:MAG: ATP-binding cassette domain-containing protein, partial [Sphingobacteriales bacterium]
MPPILSINNISKSYGSIQALRNVSFDVPKGSVFGILGPNGSGKTTLLGIILDVLQADSGSYAWFDG